MNSSKLPPVSGSSVLVKRETQSRKESFEAKDLPNSDPDKKSQLFVKKIQSRTERRSFEPREIPPKLLIRKERSSFEPKERSNDVLPLLSQTAKMGTRPSNVNKRTTISAPPKTVYKYKHVSGNNGRVILYNFRKRPW
jgi:hypothetical protein